MDEQGYNGWKNYETWLMALWIDNDQGSYTWSREIVAETVEAHGHKYEVGNALRDWQEDMMPELETSVWSDLLRTAFQAVDWYEIAENYLSELVES